MYLLFVQLKWSIFAGMTVIALLFPVNFYLTTWQRKLQAYIDNDLQIVFIEKMQL